PISANEETRLWFPMTYTDALGLFAVFGILLAAHLASSTREAAALRVLGTAAIPVLAATILLTYSRAALLLAPAALIAYVLLAQHRGVVSAFLAAGPPAAFVLIATYRASLISNGKVSAAAVHQGQALTTSIVIACAVAAAARLALLKLDTSLGRTEVPTWRRWNQAVAVGCCVAGLMFVGLGGFGAQIANKWGS